MAVQEGRHTGRSHRHRQLHVFDWAVHGIGLARQEHLLLGSAACRVFRHLKREWRIIMQFPYRCSNVAKVASICSTALSPVDTAHWLRRCRGHDPVPTRRVMTCTGSCPWDCRPCSRRPCVWMQMSGNNNAQPPANQAVGSLGGWYDSAPPCPLQSSCM